MEDFVMQQTKTRTISRRQPRQPRSRQTVEALLGAVVRVLKKHGVEGITTNRIAETAGISIGSVYQYFPDKQAIFKAIHARHVARINTVVERVLVEHKSSSLEEFVKALIEALINAHEVDVELHSVMALTVPGGGEGTRELEVLLRGAFRRALTARFGEDKTPREMDRMLFVLPHIVEALAHGAAYWRPPRLSMAAAKEEAVRAVVAYLRS
jgi:AcrR family transcriptional regulator